MKTIYGCCLAVFAFAGTTTSQAIAQYTLARQIIWPQGSPAFDHFDADDDGSSIVNSYLLAHLSMLVYGEVVHTTSSFQAHMEEELLDKGVEDVEVFVNYFTGTEGMLVTLDDAVIVVFRGTSTNGIVPNFADHIGDINVDMVNKVMGGRAVEIHGGFWNASDSVYPGLRDALQDAHAAGRKVWLTGHSLGGANALLTAMRLHMSDGVPVQGLQTFGAPKAGDIDFRSATNVNGAGGRTLASRTRRWVMQGDPIPTFFHRDLQTRWVRSWTGFNYPVAYWEYFYHDRGQVNTITRNGYQYDFNYDSGQVTINWDQGGFNDEHMDYKWALRNELERILVAEDDLQTIDDLSTTY